MKRAFRARQWRWFRPEWLLLVLGACYAAAAPPKRVVMVNPFGPGAAPYSTVASAFRTTLANELEEPLDLHQVTLDPDRVNDTEMQEALVEFLTRRFSGQGIDLVVPIGGPAGAFTARYRARIFGDAPVLFATGDPRLMPSGFLASNATHVTQKVDLLGQIEDILRLQPDTTNVVVVLGTSRVERFWEGECRREFLPFAGRMGFAWGSEFSLEDLRRKVANLPPRSFVVFSLFTLDGAGVPYNSDDAFVALHATANAPMYGYFASQFGLGAIGGRLYQDALVGRQAARVAVRILHGEKASSIAPQMIEPPSPVYDWRELKRWGIGEARLPAGSVVQFRQPSFWQTHRKPMVAGAALFVMQTVLIVGLLASRAARRKTEDRLRESEEKLSTALDAARAGAWSLDPRTNQVWASASEREMFGFSADAALCLEGFFNAIHPDDRESVRSAVENALRTTRPLSVEFRVAKPDGTVRWLLAHGHVGAGTKGRQGPFLGVTTDVTERKRAEEALHDLSGRLIRAQEEERRRVAKELHDGLSQNMALLSVELEMFGQNPEVEPVRIRSRMEELSGRVKLVSAEVHRLSHGLHPAKLEQLGLTSAIGGFCREMEAGGRIGVRFTASDVPRGVPHDVALCLYRVAQEALWNVVKHSGARQATVALSAEDGELRLTVADDGRGFDATAAPRGESLGLISMGERVRLVHGSIDVHSAAGEGTRVSVRVPWSEGGRDAPVPA